MERLSDGFNTSSYATNPRSNVQQRTQEAQDYYFKTKEEDSEHRRYMQESSYIHRLVLRANHGDREAISKLKDIDIGGELSGDSINANLHNSTLDELNKARSLYMEDEDHFNKTAVASAILQELRSDPENSDITEKDVVNWLKENPSL